MKAAAFAKLNLALGVSAPDSSGYHPLRSLIQSVDWHDEVEIDPSDEDDFSASGTLPDDRSNLAWQAVEAVRAAVEVDRPVSLRLHKEIPVAAGLGGGSADAAATLGVMGRLLGVSNDVLAELAPRLGSDVPFCLNGGLAYVTGRGERVAPVTDDIGGFAVGIVVPPFELSTAAVYSEWDALGGPEGPAIADRDLPPGLRAMAPFRNDLHPAASSLQPGIDEWSAELASRWGRPAMLSGSGPALFGYFVDADEAGAAVRDIPPGARAAAGARPTAWGWKVADGTLP